MQTYLLALAASQPYTAYQSSGDLFVYESGSAGSDTAERRIIVKPDSGGEITLRPGQRFRLAPGQMATAWNVRTLDQSVTLTGSIIIGAGDFDDANTLNKVQLDASFANNVYVNNTTAQRIPVTLDPNVPLSIAGQTVNYTNAWCDVTAAASVQTVLTPAQNPNGCYVELCEFAGFISASGAAGMVSLVAKAGTAPTLPSDGDLLNVTACSSMVSGSTGGNQGQVNGYMPNRIKVAAGKGLYVITEAQGGVWSGLKKTVLTTVL